MVQKYRFHDGHDKPTCVWCADNIPNIPNIPKYPQISLKLLQSICILPASPQSQKCAALIFHWLEALRTWGERIVTNIGNLGQGLVSCIRGFVRPLRLRQIKTWGLTDPPHCSCKDSEALHRHYKQNKDRWYQSSCYLDNCLHGFALTSGLHSGSIGVEWVWGDCVHEWSAP